MNGINCAICDVSINADNDTKEHLIPNAVGGRKKIRGFICNSCNNTTGSAWDSVLVEQLNPMCLLFGISRERGSVRSQVVETTGGERLQLNAEGSMSIEKPLYREEKIGEGVRVSITARNMNEAKKMLRGVKGKYPSIEIEEVLSKAEAQSRYCSDMLKFNLEFGGAEAGRSIVKTALALAVDSGVSLDQCQNALEYLRNPDGEACFGYYYATDLVLNRPEGVALHCVSIKGDPCSGLLLGYVEYFGVRRMVLCLGERYSGNELTRTYAINPVTGEELALDVDINLTLEEVHAAYRYEMIPSDSMESAFGKVIPLAIKTSLEKEQDRVLKEAVAFAIQNCGAKEGDTLQPEHIREASKLIAEKMMPFILHHLQLPKQQP